MADQIFTISHQQCAALTPHADVYPPGSIANTSFTSGDVPLPYSNTVLEDGMTTRLFTGHACSLLTNRYPHPRRVCPYKFQQDDEASTEETWEYGTSSWEKIWVAGLPRVVRDSISAAVLFFLAHLGVPVVRRFASYSRGIARLLIVLYLVECVSAQHQGQVRGQQIKLKKATAYALELPSLYPDINSEKSTECRRAWEALSFVPCFDKILDRGTDNGTWNWSWDAMYVVPRICTPDCLASLEDAHKQLSAKCSSSDTFLLDGYHGIFSLKWLEPGPSAAVETLLRRYRHMCRTSPTNDSDYNYCAVEMDERFSIPDGMNANLNGISIFVTNTDRKRIEPARLENGRRGSGTYRYSYRIQLRERRYGPERGGTGCTWCMFDFLNHTLSNWAEGAVAKPDSNEPVSLPDFIRHVRVAGERCAPADKWDKMYGEAIARYVDAGLLSVGWDEPEGKTEL
ncbi:hypothetical protein GQ53DRAFT_838452 [Thozetella sp. PMI_491]|nr:hypothetical protein GQ53DRAFT_838452 [Thozetella sp. PMI_491]